MNDKEYTYDIDKYTIGVDENGEDGIGLTVAKAENGEICFLGNCYGENARCLDLLIKENQELKKHLKVPKACNLKTLEDYKSYYEDTTREQILEDTYIEYCAYVNLAHRYSELKKQLEKYQQELEKADSITQSCIFNGKEESKISYRKCLNMLDKKEIQQKKFINYLEDYINSLKKEYGNYVNDNYSEEYGRYYTAKEILQKYKEIIGGNKDEK